MGIRSNRCVFIKVKSSIQFIYITDKLYIKLKSLTNVDLLNGKFGYIQASKVLENFIFF